MYLNTSEILKPENTTAYPTLRCDIPQHLSFCITYNCVVFLYSYLF